MPPGSNGSRDAVSRRLGRVSVGAEFALGRDPSAPESWPQSAPAAVAQPDVASTYAAARALLEEAKSRSARWTSANDAAATRARARRPAPGACARIYRLLRTQRPAAAVAPAARVWLPALRHSRRSDSSAGARTEGARFTPLRHETAGRGFKRPMLGHTSSALEEIERHPSRENTTRELFE